MTRIRTSNSVGTHAVLLAIFLVAAGAHRAWAADNAPLAERTSNETPEAQAQLPDAPLSEQTTIAPALTVGDAYTLAVTRGDAKKTFGGNLVKATEHWLVLRRIASGQDNYNVPVLSQLPKIGTAFRRAHSGMIEEDLWIPRDAAEIESHIRVANFAQLKPIKGSDPPTRFRCAMTLNEGGSPVRRDGNLASIGKKGVVLLVPGSFWTTIKRKVPHEEILCISVSNYVNDIRETQRDGSE